MIINEIAVEKMEKLIRNRIDKRIPVQFIMEHIIPEFYVAGNCLNKDKPNDIDIFPVHDIVIDVCEGKFLFKEKDFVELKVVSKTRNATTAIAHFPDGKKYTLQFCNYFHPSLQELVESFDFSHVQVGAKISFDMPTGECSSGYPVYFSDAYVESKLLQSTKYTGSQYPLSSLIRIIKYINRGDFSGKSYIHSVFSIINEVAKRGFKDYDDFKDQLDAVDLGMLPEDFKDVEGSDIINLFHTLKHVK